MSAIPTTVLGGYLGAGKTTLVNGLLRRAGGRRLAVLVNEFGALPIDADLIEGRDGNLLTIAGGCICCSYGSDLVGALIDLGAKRPAPDHLVIETSGVALPDAVAGSIGLIAGLSLDGVVVLVDAETMIERASDRYLADTITRQVEAADLVVLTKLDLLDPASCEARRRWLRDRWPDLRVVEAVRGDIPSDVILGRLHEGTHDATLAPGSHDPGYATIALRVLAPVPADAFARALAGADPALLRAKGFVTDTSGNTHAVQVVGRRGEATPTDQATTMQGMVMCIGSPTLSAERIADALHGVAPVKLIASAARGRWPMTQDVAVRTD